MRKRHPPFRRRKLAKKLRKLRLRARMSIQEAAKALDKDVQALYRIEAGETRVDVHLVRSMMDLYDAYEPDLLDQVRDALKAGWWRVESIRADSWRKRRAMNGAPGVFPCVPQGLKPEWWRG